MYHDQALGPFKMIAFNEGVNITLGLPFVRTSPDHGTAFDIAYQGKADSSSTLAALRLAAALCFPAMLTQIELLKKYNLRIRGHLGQHLLMDPNIIRKTVDALELQPKDVVFEIGPAWALSRRRSSSAASRCWRSRRTRVSRKC